MKLSFFEKFYLRRRGKRDGKKNLFQRCNLDELYSSDEDVADKQVCISSFIVRELSRLNGEVNFVFRFSLCNPQFDETVPKDTEAKDDNKMVKQKKQWRIMRFKKGMEWCDKEITKIDAETNAMLANYVLNMSIYSNLLNKNNIEASPKHVVEKYKNDLSICQFEYIENRNKLLEKRLSILEQRSIILSSLYIKLNKLCVKSYMRICYYYDCAKQKGRSLPSVFLSESEYIAFCGSELLNYCLSNIKSTEQEKKETLNEMASVITNISRKNDGTIEVIKSYVQSQENGYSEQIQENDMEKKD